MTNYAPHCPHFSHVSSPDYCDVVSCFTSKETLARKEVEGPHKTCIEERNKLYLSGNHGHPLEKKMIKEILHFAFDKKLHRSNAKKEEMVEQLKMLEQTDTENIMQQALGKTSGCDLSIDESVGQECQMPRGPFFQFEGFVPSYR